MSSLDEGTWLTCTRDFLASIHASVRFSFHSHSPIFWEHDQLFMDAIPTHVPYGRHRMRLINFCRLYLRISWISKLTNAAGTALFPKLCQSQSNLWWPNLLKGFCLTHWSRLQNDFFHDNFLSKGYFIIIHEEREWTKWESNIESQMWEMTKRELQNIKWRENWVRETGGRHNWRIRLASSNSRK